MGLKTLSLVALLGGCCTVSMQVQQRESQAGQLRDVHDDDEQLDEQTRETEVDAEASIPLK